MASAGGGFRLGLLVGCLASLAAALPVGAQSSGDPLPSGEPITNEGVLRASAVVDSVLLDGQADERVVSAGDFASYLMARLGVVPIPADLRFRVVPDTAVLRLTGRVADLPPEAVREIGPFVAFLDPETRLDALVALSRENPRAYRFRLTEVLIGGTRVPDDILQMVMSDVGRRYPALSRTGRDLFVEVPAGATIVLVPGGVRLVAPPASGVPPAAHD
jgi:hypothetical protein